MLKLLVKKINKNQKNIPNYEKTVQYYKDEK